MHDDDEDRDAILARRARFIAAALAGIAVTGAFATGCDGDVDDGRTESTADGAGGQPQPCLAPRGPTGEGGAGASSNAGGAGGAGGTSGHGGAGAAGGEGGAATGGAGGAGGQGGAMPCLAPPPRR